MKRLFSPFFGRMIVTASLLMLASVCIWSANTKKTVAQVTTTVTLDTDVDYTVSNATPFGDEGVVDITNTEHAVLILSKVRPSAAIKLLADHVKINGAKAVNNSNCQVKLYNLGCIILPYGTSIKPLTVYSEQNFQGESCNDFGLEHTGGYMNTLTAAKLNNKIRSFKLKRGYMVTFSLRAGGRGYSRCFIAADKDLEMATLPAVMDKKISSYRVFNWYDAGKKQLANQVDKNAMSALNVQSSYDWGQGNGSLLPDYEWVPNHIYEDYPSSATIGSTTQSPHTKNNNEPRNSSDDHPQDLTTILNNWENMMRTGLRLCSPASWDGSDYWNATGFLAEFMDSIDARGWRCDILDLHCYWPEGNFGNIVNWVNKYKRPVWISEWCWGASWNNNGAFASGVTQAQVKTALQNICSKLNSWDYVERYYYWNGERDISKIYLNGALTPAGEYYASMNSGLGYNGKYDFVPTTPKQYDFTNISVSSANGKITFSWHDPNGEFNQLMEIQKKDASGVWTTYAIVEQKELPSDYTYVVESPEEFVEYRLHLVDLYGKSYYSSDNMNAGDVIDVDGTTYYLGGNLISNSDFDMGFFGWTNGAGTTLSEPSFQVVGAGGYGNGSYLQAYGSGTINDEASVFQAVDVEPGKNYYLRIAVRNGNSNMKVSLSSTGTTEDKVIKAMSASSDWTVLTQSFNTENYTKVLFAFRALNAKAQIDKVELFQLFDTHDGAIANGVEQMKKKAEQAQVFNTKYSSLNEDLSAVVAGVSTSDDLAFNTLSKAVANHLKAIRYMSVADSLQTVLKSIEGVGCAYYNVMTARLNELKNAPSATMVIENVDEVKALMEKYFAFTDATKQPLNPSFGFSTGWETKVGSYQGGDQRVNTKDGKSFWNAWWGVSKATDPDATMEIRQTVSGLESGYYVLECAATTEHFCLSDQHAYLKYGNAVSVSPNLSVDYFDLPVQNIWQKLATAPVYLEEDSVTIGFVSSKDGAVDRKWHAIGKTTLGDYREGWWGATDFVLKFHPLYKLSVVPDEWGIVCLPYAVPATDNLKFYQIVGINATYDQLCLEEMNEAQAGVPCVYRSSVADALFYEYGAAESTALNGPGNLRGFFKSSSRVPKDYFYMKNGVMTKQTESTSSKRPYVGDYTAIMYPFSDKKNEGLTVYDNWTGATLPIEGITQEDIDANVKVTSLSSIVKDNSKIDGIYTIDGRRLSDSSTGLKKGLYIKVVDGHAQKVILK